MNHPTPRASILSAVLLLVCWAWPNPAHAARLTSRAWVGAHGAGVRPGTILSQFGPGAQLGVDLSFGDFWGVYGGLNGSYHLAKPSEELPAALVSDAFVGLRYNFDVFKYVPYVGAGVVGYLDAPPIQGADGPATYPGLGGKLTIGVLWRPRRAWSVGALIELHGAMSNLTDFSLYSTAGLNVGYHWRW